MRVRSPSCPGHGVWFHPVFFSLAVSLDTLSYLWDAWSSFSSCSTSATFLSFFHVKQFNLAFKIIIIIIVILFIYFFLTGFLLLPRLPSGCGEGGLLSRCGVRASRRGDFSCCTVWILEHMSLSSSGSQALERRLNSCGLVAPRHVGSSRIRDWTHVFFFGRQSLYHWATREPHSGLLTDALEPTIFIWKWPINVFSYVFSMKDIFQQYVEIVDFHCASKSLSDMVRVIQLTGTKQIILKK